jgi:hypothetical protein
MKTKRTLLVACAVSAIVLSALSANAVVLQPLIVTDPTGTVRAQQALPCGDDLDITRPIAGGRIEVTPVSVREQILFDLTRLDLFLAPFSVHRACRGIEATANFSEIGVRLAGAVTFPAEAVGSLDSGQFRFTIPKDKFLIYESVLDNASVRQPETAYQKPSEDVTGLIDLRNRTVEIHVSLASQLRFRAGCVGDTCVIDAVKDGTQAADIVGRITPPAMDTDSDGVPDVVDNCPLTANSSQAPVASPVITAPPDVTLHSCLDHSIGRAAATDICNARPVLITNNAPVRFAAGLNLVTWFGNDAVDPIVTALQQVTIQDTSAPTVSCTAVNPPGRRFQVAAADDCNGRITVGLGSYALANGEVIQIEETERPGVRLVGVGADGIRRFVVGRGEGIIMTADAAGNVARAVCR